MAFSFPTENNYCLKLLALIPVGPMAIITSRHGGWAILEITIPLLETIIAHMLVNCLCIYIVIGHFSFILFLCRIRELQTVTVALLPRLLRLRLRYVMAKQEVNA